MAYGRRQFSHAENYRTADSRTYADPTLLFCRRMIDQAFHDALNPRGDIAGEARSWLAARTDWTLRKTAEPPPREVREEFAGTFEWACRILQENPQDVRANGLTRTFYVGSSQGAETWAKRKGPC
jgi:hypothetical protein